MTKSKTTFEPSNFSLERKITPSDGFLFGTTWDNRHDNEKCVALELIEKAVRGTMSHRQKDAVINDPVKLNTEINKPNPQRVDACYLDLNQDTLKIKYTLKILSGIEDPCSCNSSEYGNKYTEKLIEYCNQDDSFDELALRYAINIANGRALWRNRLGAERIETVVTYGSRVYTFTDEDFNLFDFEIDEDNEDAAENIKGLAGVIAAALRGDEQFAIFTVETYALVGNGQEVYPSEEMVYNKSDTVPTGSKENPKSKILYSVRNQAALHSQKVGNAIRTIDTWYPEYDPEVDSPIPVGVYGAVTTKGRAYRTKNTDFFSIFDKFMVDGELTDDEMNYMIAMIICGGVFGKSKEE